MSDTVKLIIEMPADVYRKVQAHKSCIVTTKQDDQEIVIGVRKGIPLDDIKTEIEEYKSTVDRAISEDELKIEGMKEAYANCLEILDNVGKVDKRGTE